MFKWLKKKLTEIVHGQASWLFSTLPRTDFDYQKEVGIGLGSSVLMAPVHWVARVFPEAPLVLRKQAGDEVETIATHPMLDLITKPNDFYSGTKMWMATILSWLLAGNAYWIKIRNNMGAVVELWYIPHWMIQPKWPHNSTTFITHYLYNPGGGQQRIEVEDVVHFRFGLDPRNTRLGMSPILSVLRAVFTDDEAENFVASMLRNMGVVGVVLSPKGSTVSWESAQLTKEKFNQEFGGDKRGSTMVMTGPTDIQTVGTSIKEMDLGPIRNVSEERVCAVLGIPAAVVGFGTGLQQTKVGATMREMVRLAWTGCIIPNQRLLAEDVQTQLLPDFEPRPQEFKVWFDNSDVEALQESVNEEFERLGKGVVAGWLKVSDARAATGFEVADSDRVYLRSLQILEIPEGEPAPSPFGEPKGFKQQRFEPTVQQIRFVDILDRQFEHFSQVFSKDLLSFFDSVGRTAAAAAREVLKSIPINGSKTEADDIRDANEIIQRMEMSNLDDLLKKKGGKHYLNVANSSYESLESVLGLAIDMTDELAVRITAEGGRRLGLIDLGKQTRERLFRELTQGREAGEGIPKLVARIRDGIPQGPWKDVRTRARMIARTETKHAQRTSVLTGYRESGVVSQVLVIDDRLGFGDDDCTFWNGQVVSFEQADFLAGDEHPNGTRDFVPVIQ